MSRLLIVVGTRPEAIKMAPLIRRLKATSEFEVSVCSSGQHREMNRQVFDLFSIVPKYNLDVMQPDQALSDLTARVIKGMDSIIGQHCPDRVLVHGDTTTTLGASLAAYYRRVPVGHVEAGLRTGDIYAPWPEEINRKLTDAVADRLYAPTARAAANLRAEGAAEEKIFVTGNTVIDALFDIVRGPLADEKTEQRLREQFSYVEEGKKVLLVTCHRRESYGEGFRNICAALSELALRPDVQVIFPIHPNPNVRAGFSLLADRKEIRLIEPLDYLEFVYMLSRCHIVITDSGGIQEEAPSLGKPVLVLRRVTERPEAVVAGTVKLVGPETDPIVRAATKLLDDPAAYAAMSAIHNPYGDGKACERIIASLCTDLH